MAGVYITTYGYKYKIGNIIGLSHICCEYRPLDILGSVNAQHRALYRRPFLSIPANKS